MDSKSKVLVQNSELSNLYEDIAKDILKNLVFDSSHENQINQLLFISMLENALSHLADDTLDLFNKPKDEISKLNYIYKWNSLKQCESIKNIVQCCISNCGFSSSNSLAHLHITVNDTITMRQRCCACESFTTTTE